MKRNGLILALIVALLLCLGCCALAEKNGWEIDGTHIFYYKNDEMLRDVTESINGTIYSFTSEGPLYDRRCNLLF